MISKDKKIIETPEFDVKFSYGEKDKEGYIIVSRLSGGDILQTIKFWENDRLTTFEQFRNSCSVWCDENIA